MVPLNKCRGMRGLPFRLPRTHEAISRIMKLSRISAQDPPIPPNTHTHTLMPAWSAFQQLPPFNSAAKPGTLSLPFLLPLGTFSAVQAIHTHSLIGWQLVRRAAFRPTHIYELICFKINIVAGLRRRRRVEVGLKGFCLKKGFPFAYTLIWRRKVCQGMD